MFSAYKLLLYPITVRTLYEALMVNLTDNLVSIFNRRSNYARVLERNFGAIIKALCFSFCRKNIAINK